jgi:hypothetical protein
MYVPKISQFAVENFRGCPVVDLSTYNSGAIQRFVWIGRFGFTPARSEPGAGWDGGIAKTLADWISPDFAIPGKGTENWAYQRMASG